MRVAVVGAGIVGVAIADALAQRGIETVVFDGRAHGRGASRASAGILAPYVEASEGSPLLRLGVRSLAMYDGFVAGASARSGRRVEYARCGTLQAAFTADEATHLREAADWLAARGVPHERLDAAGVRQREPSIAPAAVGGLFIPEHAYTGVSSLVIALAQSARLAGAVFETPVEITRITPRRDGVELRAGDRRLDADVAVIAAGSWAGRSRLDGAAALPIRPVRGQLLQIEWPSAILPPPARIIWGSGCYIVPWSDGTVLVGATMEEAGFDERTTVGGVTLLATAAMALLPALAGATLVDARAGLRPATPDGLPVIGPSAASPRVWWATGHFRNGILLAPLTAELVVRGIVDGAIDEDLKVTDARRFE